MFSHVDETVNSDSDSFLIDLQFIKSIYRMIANWVNTFKPTLKMNGKKNVLTACDVEWI